MKLAIAGKGGVGKTSLTVWLGDYLARQGEEVILLDADTALSLGQALGLKEDEIPIPLIQNKELIRERVGEGFFQINPKVDDLPGKISKQVGNLKFMVMGTIADAGSGCACSPNALVKALLAHLRGRSPLVLACPSPRAWLDEAKAEHVATIDLAGKTSIGDFMVIATGRSDRHVGSVAEQIAKKLKEQGLGRVRVEGLEACDWVLIDTGDIIVHVFRPEVREFYNLEKMWSADRPGEHIAH